MLTAAVELARIAFTVNCNASFGLLSSLGAAGLARYFSICAANEALHGHWFALSGGRPDAQASWPLTKSP